MPYGFSDTSTLELVAKREAAYRVIGEDFNMSHELLPQVPHIDVYIFKPSEDRPFYTFVTGGMSDLPMKVPEGVPERVELVLYALEQKDSYIELIRWMAHLIHDKSTWVSAGSTMSNGQPALPIFPNSSLDFFLFLPCPVSPDSEILEQVFVNNQSVSLLWLIPITSAERHFVATRDIMDFIEILSEHEHPLEVQETRLSYINT
jgi:hypothetical protein